MEQANFLRCCSRWNPASNSSCSTLSSKTRMAHNLWTILCLSCNVMMSFHLASAFFVSIPLNLSASIKPAAQATTYQLVWSFGQKTNNWQVALWVGGGTDGLADAFNYIHAFAAWKATKDATPVPPLHCWLPDGVTLDLPALTIQSSIPPIRFEQCPAPLHLKSISPRRFGDIPSMVLLHP